MPTLRTISAHSPYLSDLARREPATVEAILQQGPDAVCDAALLDLSRLKPAATRREVAAAMRLAKRHVALATAMADIGGAWTLEQVTGALSDLADTALRVACRHLLAHAHARGELRLPHPNAPDRGCGFVVLAMGKLGARELNYSSDVDLILLYDPGEDDADLGPVFARMARDLAQLMEARDSGGYVFRVDLRLRPDPASTPPALALPGALAYYESQGQTWERAALIKARPVAGDIALGRRFLDAIRPFIWRRHLDFAALADISAMKRRIDAHKGTALVESGTVAERLLGHDLKLGQGGIREIEFCAQALQLVWGGRSPALRQPATLAALHAQAGEGHMPAGDVAALEQAYRFLRRAEHRLQMVGDRQTHSLPSSAPALAAFAAFLGFADVGAFAEQALGHVLRVSKIFGGLFAEEKSWGDRAGPPRPPVENGASPNFRRGVWGEGHPPPSLFSTADPWLAGRPRALRTERSRALLRDMLPAIGAALARQPDPEAALTRLDEFIYRLPAGVQVFSLLHHNPALLDRLAEMLGAAPALADHLASFPASLEGLVSPDMAPLPRLTAQLGDAAGLEDAALIAARTVRAEEFAIASAEFFGRIGVDEAAGRRTALADATIRALAGRAMTEHAARHGRVAGGGMAVVALGKAGSGEMMAGSDLDLMLIYDHDEDAGESGGARRLAPSQYFARAAQSFIAALTLPTRHGPLYAVDMRLRPSGRAGPVAVSLRAFMRYHERQAWTWERLALTRARVVTAPMGLRRAVQAAIAAARQAGDPALVLADTRAMRARLAREQPVRGPWDVRRRPGGLLDVEFTAQALQLLHAGAFGVSARPAGTAARLGQLARLGALPAAEAALLARADRTWRGVQSLLRIGLGPQIPAQPAPAVLEKLSRATGLGPDEAGLRAGLDDLAAAVRAAFLRHIGDIEGS